MRIQNFRFFSNVHFELRNYHIMHNFVTVISHLKICHIA